MLHLLAVGGGVWREYTTKKIGHDVWLSQWHHILTKFMTIGSHYVPRR